MDATNRIQAPVGAMFQDEVGVNDMMYRYRIFTGFDSTAENQNKCRILKKLLKSENQWNI